MTKFLDENGLLYYHQKVKAGLNNKVDKETGKGLSTNDYTTDEKNKLAGLNNYSLPTASAETLGGIKVGAGLVIHNGVLSASGGGTADSVDWSNVTNKPTKVSEFINDSNYQTGEQVSTAINDAISGISGIEFEVVTSLPSTGTKGVIYLVSNSGSGSNVYDEYIYVNNAFEKIGTTNVDLSNYYNTSNLTPILNSEIDTIVAGA